jgi:hypothetical protein
MSDHLQDPASLPRESVLGTRWLGGWVGPSGGLDFEQ